MSELDCSGFAGKKVAYLSTYLPRECGIATFTNDLVDATEKLEQIHCSVIAVNEKGAIYDYDRRVKWSIERDKLDSYIQAAKYVNDSSVDLVSLQHEFGLFGGDCGEYITAFLEHLQKPVVTTLHTVQPDFSSKAREVLQSIFGKSVAVVVIASIAKGVLEKQGLPSKKCVVIPHGCPEIEFGDNRLVKESLGLRDRLVVSTFGLISSGKGIEYAIRAFPDIVKKDPRVVYLVIGETHPEVRKKEGEKYRNKLMALVTELGLENHVRFHNRFLTNRELIRYLKATDIYLTPYVSPNQISSGTLTYALGAGKPVVSTPYLHAQEALAEGRGFFCRFKDAYSIAEGVTMLLDDKIRETVQKRVYQYSRRFLWSNVAREYVELFNRHMEQIELTH
jgi:glycosyltransferase involved in cell wall biosynthesis